MSLDKAEATGGFIHVAGSTEVYDTRPNDGFIWRLRLLDSADQTAVKFEQLYPDKIFRLKEDLNQSATFDDIFQSPVGPGKYVVELRWLRIDPVLGMAAIQDPDQSGGLQGPPGCMDLVVD